MSQADYLEPYQQAVQDHGTVFEATLWATRKTQELRFRTFTEMVFFPGKRVLDAGCSRGDFAAYLMEQGVVYEQFIGVDGVPEVIAFARTRGLPDSEFVAGDFVQQPDLLGTGQPQIVTMSGTLNTMPIDLALRVLDSAWDAAAEALIFNFLPTTCGAEAPRQEYPAVRLETQAILDWAFRKTWSVQYRQDYFPNAHDATVLMRKV